MPLQLPEIVSLASAYYGSAVLFAALELDLFTALARAADPTAPALAAELGADPRGLELLLNGAVAVGLLTKSGERFADTIERIGFENAEAQLMGDELLKRKAEILGLHVVGGASC